MITKTWPPAEAPTINQAPIEIIRNGADTAIAYDSSNPANSLGLPVYNIGPNGTVALVTNTPNSNRNSLEVWDSENGLYLANIDQYTSNIADSTTQDGVTAAPRAMQIAGWDGSDSFILKTDGLGVLESNARNQFEKDGSRVYARQDTVTPANNQGLPICIVGAEGQVDQYTDIDGDVALKVFDADNYDIMSRITTDIAAVLPSKGVVMLGTDGALARVISTDNTGKVNVLSGQLATTLGQKTEANSPSFVLSSFHTDSNGYVKTIERPAPGTVTNAAISFGTSATRLTVSGSAPASGRCKLMFMIEPPTTGSPNYYLGSLTVASSGVNRGTRVYPGTSYVFDNDEGDYFIISDTASQTVTIMEKTL